MKSSSKKSASKKLTSGELLSRYATLVAECGWGGRAGIAGKPIHIYFAAASYELALAISKAAYKCGAHRVDLSLWSPTLDAMHVDNASDAGLVDVPKHWGDRWNDLVDVGGCTIRIEGNEEPLAMAKSDAKRIAALLAARKESREKFYRDGLHTGKTPWCLIPYATDDWAKQLFPKLPVGKGKAKLEAALVKVLGLEHSDFVKRWWARGARIARRSQALTALGISELHFTGPGTDLYVPLHKNAEFGGGMHDGTGTGGKKGVKFFANLPTFESYTTPDCRGVRGVARMTRPIEINGQEVSGLSVKFEKGSVVSFAAKKGEAAFRSMLETDPGARRLGEVALVGIDDSPIFSTGIIFRNILLDENAACHIAFGDAYTDRLRGAHGKSAAQLFKEFGCNNSKVHVDCMISDATTSVSAVCRDGKEVMVINKGEWVGKFK